jgi:hypothetical protein
MKELLTVTIYTLRDPIWQTMGMLSSIMIVAMNSLYSLLQKGNTQEISPEKTKYILHYSSIIVAIIFVLFIAIVVVYRVVFV